MSHAEDLFTLKHKMKHNVTDCPIDHQLHEYTLEIKYHTGIVIEALERITEDAFQKQITFTCPNTQKTFVESVKIPQIKDAEFEDVSVIPATTSSPGHSSNNKDNSDTKVADDTDSENVYISEFEAWTKGSAQTASDYSKTMISTATGAVAVFYAVLTFLGIGGGGTSTLSSLPGYPWLGVLPPILFFVSAIVFVVAFQPHTKRIDSLDDFIAFRNQRLRYVGTLIIIGTILFLVGVALAIVAYIVVIFK
jgi:hypothetical protein